MNSILDVQKLLKRFGTFIYTGDRLADLGLMEEEIQSLFENKLITNEEYMRGIMVIKHEKRKLH